MNTNEVLKLALEALEINNKAWKALADSGDAGFWEAEEQPFYELSVKAITALLEALAEQPAQQEPVAWMYPSDYEKCLTSEHVAEVTSIKCTSLRTGEKTTIPLYTSPPAQRTWVGLSDEEMRLIDPDGFEDNLPQMIQQALKEKNT